MALLVDLESMEMLHDVLGVLGVALVVPIVLRVLVEARVNEADEVLVVQGR